VKRLLVGCIAGVLGACATNKPPPVPPIPAAATVADLSAAIAADSQRSYQESDSKVRSDLADDAMRNAKACIARDAHSAACLYGRAIGLGLQARAHPADAIGLLNDMLRDLGSADDADPNYDQAGPSRVRALVLLRAPSWPLGPGDERSGLEWARNAVMLQPQYAPNLLALGEALARTGDAKGAAEAYTKARKLAEAAPAGAERDDWLRQADEGVRRK
jgi:tetratricopeptide (TPR) repeat protein